MTNSADPDQLASTSLDLHCLLRQDMSWSAREGLTDFRIYNIYIPPGRRLRTRKYLGINTPLSEHALRMSITIGAPSHPSGVKKYKHYENMPI